MEKSTLKGLMLLISKGGGTVEESSNPEITVKIAEGGRLSNTQIMKKERK